MSLGLAAYWLLVLGAGSVLLDLVPLDWQLSERAAGALVVGLVASSLLSLALALAFGVGPAAAISSPAILLAAGTSVRMRRWRRRLRLGPGSWLSWLRSEWDRPGARSGVVVAALLGAAFFGLFSSALVQAGRSIEASYPAVWSDWSVHASYVQSFLVGPGLPVRDALESATGMRYPFLPDFQAALLGALGQNLVGSLDIPSWLVSWAAAVLLWQLGYRVTRRRAAASVALTLALLGGGLGFIGLYGDGCQQLAHTSSGFSASACTRLSSETPGAVTAFIGHLPAELTHLPRSYDGQSQSDPPLADLYWYEPLLVYWLPQRDFDYGVALVALLSLLLWEGYRGRRRELLVAAGVGGAALPWFNPFGFLVVFLIGLWWLGRQRWWRGLGLFLLPLLLLGLPRMLYILGGPHGQLANPVGTNLFPELDVGWLAHAATVCTAAQFNRGSACDALYLPGSSLVTSAAFLAQSLIRPSVWADTAGFWLANTGIFTVLAVGLLALRRFRSRAAEELVALELTRFWAPFWLLFLIGNLVVTQPWNWDNTKLLDYWYVGAAIPVAWLLCALSDRAWWRWLAGLLTISLVLSGALSLDLAMLGQSSLAQSPRSSPRLGWADQEALEVARAVLRRTPKTAVFLTEGQPNDPVTTLAGRTVVLAYDGWLWSYGEPLRSRFQAVGEMYAGCGGPGPCALGRLLRTYDVSYVEFEPGDYNGIAANLSWYESQHLPVVVRTKSYVIFDVRGLWQRRP
ncbi:MAG: hypothetical protein ABSF27_04935 [Candidatus Dormibacteria bacterium]